MREFILFSITRIVNIVIAIWSWRFCVNKRGHYRCQQLSFAENVML